MLQHPHFPNDKKLSQVSEAEYTRPESVTEFVLCKCNKDAPFSSGRAKVQMLTSCCGLYKNQAESELIS